MRAAPLFRSSVRWVILLVDDNIDGNSARRSVLQELGYTVVPAGSGPEALALIDKQDFDLVVTDYRMSPMNGLELIKSMRERGFGKHTILLTGFAENLGLRPETTGADIVIQKSANEIVILVRHIKRLLNVPRKLAGSQTKRVPSRIKSK